MSSRLVIEEAGDHELVRVRRWPGASLDDYRLLAVEQRILGLGKPRETALDGSIVRLDWGGKSDRTGLALLHPLHGVCHRREPLPFVRSIIANISFIHETRRIVQDVGADGTPTRHYDVAMRNLSSKRRCRQKLLYKSSRRCAWQAETKRRQIRDGARPGLQWFNDQAAAEAAVRRIIGFATKSLTIVDAYFGPLQLRDFALAVTGRDVAVRILTSAEYLRAAMEPPHDGPADLAMERALASISMHGAQPEVRVMPGQQAELHDRFLIVDGRLWFSGNSLNAIGARASMMVEMPNPDEVLLHLEPVISRAEPFAEWLAARRAAQAGRHVTE